MGELIGGAYKSSYSGDYIDDALNKSACFKRGAAGTNSVVMGNVSNNSATGNYSHAEGNGTTASNRGTHAEGAGTAASGPDSHAEGSGCYADGSASHAEGLQTTADGSYSHAEGDRTYAQGNASHAEGYGTRTDGRAQHVFGEYNEYNEDQTDRKDQRGDFVEMVGCGNSSNRSNARVLDWNGNEKIKGGLYVNADTSTATLDENKRVLAAANTASAFDSTATYAIGSYCIYDGSLYRCTVPHTGAWNASHFEQVTVGGELAISALPIITKQPDDVYVGTNEPSSMTVEVEGQGPFSYQWQIWDAPAGAWANSSATGNKTDTVTVTANAGAFNGGRRFRCAVENANGTVYSRPALVNPDAPIALAYSAQSTYAVDDFCINNGILQRCTTPITTPEPWTAAHWAVEHVDGAFVSKTLLKSIAAAATSFSDFKSRIAAM